MVDEKEQYLQHLLNEVTKQRNQALNNLADAYVKLTMAEIEIGKLHNKVSENESNKD